MYKKILVINLMHIGDLLLVTPVLRTLRTNFPNAHIALLADKKLAALVQYNKHIDECLLIDKKGEDNTLPNFVRFIRKIRRKHFDLVINLHRNERASAIAAFSGAKKNPVNQDRYFRLIQNERQRRCDCVSTRNFHIQFQTPKYFLVDVWQLQHRAEYLQQTLHFYKPPL